MQENPYEGLPFEVEKLTAELEIRKFRSETPTEEMKWHRDQEDRLVRKVSGDGWMLQLDDQLPVLLRANESHFIPALVWHRLVKMPEATDLVVHVHKRV